MKTRWGLLFLFFLCYTESLYCQKWNPAETTVPKVVFGVNAQFGKILKHTSKFSPSTTGHTSHYEWTASFRTFGHQPWERKSKYPEIGVSFFYSRFGNRTVFGEGYALFPHVTFWMYRHKHFDMNVRIGSGIAYLNKPFDIVNNPENNVIGSHINNITQLRIGFDFHLKNNIDIIAAAVLTHFSNSRAQSPNLGINTATGMLGIRYSPLKKQYTYEQGEIPKPDKRNHYYYRFSIGINDHGAVGGPKFPIYINTLFYARQTSVINRVWTGITFAFDQGEYDFILVQEIDPKNKRGWASSDFSLFVGDEIVLNKIGVFFVIGAYLFNPEFKSDPVYAKVGVNYYFYEFGTNDHKLYLGVNLKSHYSVAEFLEIGGGIAF